MGWLPEAARGHGRKVIWVHAVSVGEFLAAKPLIEGLKRDLPGHRIVVSTTTLTGQQLARSQSPSFAASFYFPFDWKFAVRRALAWVEPSVVVILETELWPNFLRECRRRRVAIVLANGRISPRSFQRYVRVRSFIRRVLEDFSLLVMQSASDADRAVQLGADPERVRVCGNLKYDVETVEAGMTQIADSKSQILDRTFALSSSPHLIVAGSTGPEEESILLGALRQVRKQPELADARLLIAPRHPERFNDVAIAIAKSRLTHTRRSQTNSTSTSERVGPLANEFGSASADDTKKGPPRVDARTADVILLDSIGELASVYRFAAVAFVGGSLVPQGGHNIIEPAASAKPIIVGPHTENFRQIVADFARDDAVVQLKIGGEDSADSLANWLIRLLTHRDEARAMGERARDILLRSRGATDCTLAAIGEILKTED
jgi:3-deoxy-D-manno-octulosonic-acid transferase